jgi:hypothetical protein
MEYESIPAGATSPPPDGFYSPCSAFYNTPPLPLPENQQLNQEWQTYPYIRSFNDSYRKVEVIVRFGTGGNREYRLISLIGDPIAPLDPDPVRISYVSGPTTLSKASPNNFAVYEVEVLNADGNEVPDVPVIWNVVPTSTGSAVLVPEDATGRTVRVYPSASSGAGTRVFLGAKIRYGGQEFVGEMTSSPLQVSL